jgi:hypothetical protein
MRRIVFATASIVMLIASQCIAEAGQITYSIQNYLADQQGATLSGTITTDGVIGNLAATDILSWNWTITPLGGTPYTLSSSDIGTKVLLEGVVVASQSNITIALPTQDFVDNALALEALNAGGITTSYIDYLRGLPVGSPFNEYIGVTSVGADVWANFNPVMGGTNPWVIAAASAVPEPSSLALAGLGAAWGIALGLARKRRTKAISQTLEIGDQIV